MSSIWTRAYDDAALHRLLKHSEVTQVNGSPVLVKSATENLPHGALDPWLARHLATTSAGKAAGLELTPDMLADPEALLLELRDRAAGLNFSAEDTTSVDLCTGPVDVRRHDLTLVDHPTPVWVYEKADSAGPNRPVFIHVHSGGFFMGRPTGRDNFLRYIADRADAVVLDVDYSLSPEVKFPAAVHETVAAVTYVLTYADELGVDPNRIALGGGSAGGNLTAVGSLLVRQRGMSDIALQVIINAPVLLGGSILPGYTWPADDFPSESPAGPFLDPQQDPALRLMFDAYAGGHDSNDPLMSPALAPDLTGLPPALVITAELDSLRPEAEHYAGQLAAAGVPVRTLRYRGTRHDTQGLFGYVPSAEAVAVEVVTALRALPGNPFPADHRTTERHR